MRLVPSFVAEMYLPDLSTAEAKRLATCGREVGERVEVDLDLVAERVSGEVAELLEAYWAACERFWDVHETRKQPCVRIRREVAQFQQKNTKSEKKDLTAQMEALDEVAGVGELVRVVTEKSVDESALEQVAQGAGAVWSREGAWTRVEVASEADVEWPRSLGGARSRGEVRRIFTLSVNHAAWRDRRNRRLVEVVVEVEEIWPRP